MKRRLFLHRSLPLLVLPLASLPAMPRARASRPAKGITTPDGQARDHERIVVGLVPIQFKVLSKDTDGDMAAFVSTNNVSGFGPPLHVHHSTDDFFVFWPANSPFRWARTKPICTPAIPF